jgi:hypothetical protein
MQLTGRKTRSVFERYNIVSECDLVEAAQKAERDAAAATRWIKVHYFRSSRAQFGHNDPPKQVPPSTEPLIA